MPVTQNQIPVGYNQIPIGYSQINVHNLCTCMSIDQLKSIQCCDVQNHALTNLSALIVTLSRAVS